MAEYQCRNPFILRRRQFACNVSESAQSTRFNTPEVAPTELTLKENLVEVELFAAGLNFEATQGAGVDVILNSLTGELMEESWRCIAAGGTMVKLGKRNMLDRNYLSMEPLGRNASYRCFDMSHTHVSGQLISRNRLLDEIMNLINKRQLTPIGPIKTFSFADIPTAFGYMRRANHIGKIVISDGPDAEVQVEALFKPGSHVFTTRFGTGGLSAGFYGRSS
ncbi:beta-ketoacyl synthase domain-containing protein [Penicillium alfredii]|uniref:Beta-ketoacyl synthase domain-containing protein n=1 Tax=Penicillium alfredii TaxID=1506179 RepID=A0A9W9GAU7_9EURO|nr:beta-ketoacyl synthase domain-containing protein [Penicillium alfredii]KAJ5115344.1 beta-ketoacyl synthase domain-containing protein [Penicillium alfredii]